MSAVQMGQHASASHVVVHLSDTHFLAGAARLHDRVDTDRTVRRAMEQLERSGIRPDAMVITGDIADRGEADAYRRVRGMVEESATRLGTRVIWVMGNHDARAAFRTELLGEEPSDAPVDGVFDANGLRIIALDTSVPGYHHGELSADQLAWLADVLKEPAAHGSLLALHHPPLPTPLPLMDILELKEQQNLASVIAGSDIRAILGGHLHYSTNGLFAGIPVSVAAATCYTMDLSAPVRKLTGMDGGQSIHLVHVYDTQVVHSVVPIGSFPDATMFPDGFLERMEGLTPEGRLEAFSRQV